MNMPRNQVNPMEKKEATRKPVKLKLVGIDGNAYSIMGAWQQQAKNEGWPKEEIDAVLKEAMSGDYSHLVTTISRHCKNGGYR